MLKEIGQPDFDAVVVGAGIGGIYQIKRLVDLGLKATVLEAAADLGGTWYSNRYPGCRFDSESYSYGYSFSRELLDEWHWKERFSSQPENLRYLNYVADKFDLRRHMQFGCRLEAAHFDEDAGLWRLTVSDGRRLTTRFLILGTGLLSMPTLPRIPGMDRFKGQQFHTFHWPHEAVELAGKKVAVIGAGATAIQVIGAIAGEVSELVAFQRRPNWCAPLNNGPISESEMADIRARYDEIFARCASTPTGFVHEPDRRGFYNVTREERVALWDRLYGAPGFGIWMGNFTEIFMNEEANAEFSEYMADKVRGRVKDPVLAEKLIPRDHGFGVQRVPLETNYLEAFNLPHVKLVDLRETPIECVTETGLRTSAGDHDVDLIVYATGFDAVTGSQDRIDIRGTGGLSLKDKWDADVSTFMGVMVHGFPNMLMISGPQGASASTNYPRGIETAAGWCADLIEHMERTGQVRVETTSAAEAFWTEHVKEMYASMLMRKAKSWFTGYNSNVAGHEEGKVRYMVYNGGAHKYAARLRKVAAEGYAELEFQGVGAPAPLEAGLMAL